jgi:hypothetical protein
MADFVTHGLIGAGVSAAPVKFISDRWVSLPPIVKKVVALYGFLLGIWPDVGDWLAALLKIYPRWELYTYYHRDADWWWLMNPGFFFHVKITDPPFHVIPGWNWWPTMWSVEILWVLFAVSLLWYTFRWEIMLIRIKFVLFWRMKILPFFGR